MKQNLKCILLVVLHLSIVVLLFSFPHSDLYVGNSFFADSDSADLALRNSYSLYDGVKFYFLSSQQSTTLDLLIGAGYFSLFIIPISAFFFWSKKSFTLINVLIILGTLLGLTHFLLFNLLFVKFPLFVDFEVRYKLVFYLIVVSYIYALILPIIKLLKSNKGKRENSQQDTVLEELNRG